MKRSSEIHFQQKVMIIIAISGIAFSATGLVATWIVKSQINRLLLGLLDSLDQALLATDEGLKTLSEVITVSTDNLDIFETSMADFNETLDGLSASLSSSAELIGDDLQLTIIETQIALSSAAASAVFIDDTLAFIASIPLIGVDYQPDVPLHTSLEQAASSLEDMPEALEDIEQNLNTTAGSIDALNNDLKQLTTSITSLDDELDHAGLIIVDYQDIVESLSQRSMRIRKNLSFNLTAGSLVISGAFFYLGFTQVFILLEYKREQHGERLVDLANIRRE